MYTKDQVINSWPLEDGLIIHQLSELNESHHNMTRKYFDQSYPILRWRQELSESENNELSLLNQNLKARASINLIIYKGEEIIGWSYGWQGGFETGTYYMANSCIIPEYRNQGLYSILLKKTIEIARELNFQTITSRHVVSTNPILIAKLKAGFNISSVEMSEVHGTLVHLTYFMNKLRAESYKVRTGLQRSNTSEVLALFNQSS